MTDLLSIATYAANQLLDWDVPVVLSMDVHFATGGFIGSAMAVELHNLNRKEVTMSTTATIIAEMRAANSAAIESFNESVDETVEANGKRMRRAGVISTGGPRYSLAYGKGRTDALLASQVLLKGCGEFDRNAVKREHSMPARALSMASSKGRCTPDMLSSLMAFFASPGDMAHTLLVSFLPELVSSAQAKELLSDPFVVDVIEGLGHKVPAPAEAIKMLKQAPRNGRGGRLGASGRVRIYSPGVAPTVDAKRRGRPSGPKYVASLPPVGTGHSKAYTSDALPMGRIPGGNDVAHGAGHDQGIGWEAAQEQGKALSPAQVSRRDAALDAYHAAAAKLAAEMAAAAGQED